MRLVVVVLMYIGTFYYLGETGVNAAPLFDIPEQMKSLATVFGNTAFVFIFHHSITGIVYPIRPQSEIRNMFFVSHIVGASLLALEGFLAYLAFSGLHNNCDTFPCAVQPLFNENFLNIPVIG